MHWVGELEFDRWVDTYKDPEWIVMKDIWIEAGGVPFELKETIVFINEHATVEVKKKIREPYILRNEIKNYFNKMKHSSGHGQFNPFHIQSEIKRFMTITRTSLKYLKCPVIRIL